MRESFHIQVILILLNNHWMRNILTNWCFINFLISINIDIYIPLNNNNIIVFIFGLFNNVAQASSSNKRSSLSDAGKAR